MKSYATGNGADRRMFNVDRWTYYSWQRACQSNDMNQLSRVGCGYLLNMTPAQLRRCKKKARKHNDMSIGLGNQATPLYGK